MQEPILFLRGFNSYETGDLRVGPLNLGRVDKHLTPALARHGVQLTSLPVLGRTDLSTQVQEVTRTVENFCRERAPQRYHLLGHSLGGVVARGVVHALAKSQTTPLPTSVVTITSPHRGTRLAERALRLRHESPAKYRVFRTLGYDIKKREHMFYPLQTSQMQTFNEQVADVPGVRYASIVSGKPYEELSAIFRFINAPAEPHYLSDGIVDMASQPWGEVLGKYSLDHAEMIGFKINLAPAHRPEQRWQFADMISRLAHFYRE